MIKTVNYILLFLGFTLVNRCSWEVYMGAHFKLVWNKHLTYDCPYSLSEPGWKIL